MGVDKERRELWCSQTGRGRESVHREETRSDGRKAGVAPALCSMVSHGCRTETAVCESGVRRVGGEKLESAATESGLRHVYLNGRGMRDWAWGLFVFIGTIIICRCVWKRIVQKVRRACCRSRVPAGADLVGRLPSWRGPGRKTVQRGEGRPDLANDAEPSLVPARLSG